MTGWTMGAVLCCQCGRLTTAGAHDWLGRFRFRCEDCAIIMARPLEASRLTSVAAEVAERAAMWEMPDG